MKWFDNTLVSALEWTGVLRKRIYDLLSQKKLLSLFVFHRLCVFEDQHSKLWYLNIWYIFFSNIVALIILPSFSSPNLPAMSEMHWQ